MLASLALGLVILPRDFLVLASSSPPCMTFPRRLLRSRPAPSAEQEPNLLTATPFQSRLRSLCFPVTFAFAPPPFSEALAGGGVSWVPPASSQGPPWLQPFLLPRTCAYFSAAPRAARAANQHLHQGPGAREWPKACSWIVSREG